ncbi:MAG: ABC transporter permease [Oscillospiraceae bacterium]|nr:ABC transporter permease [Oscillospiraceae bacterium]
MFAIYKREMKAYFTSPIAYIFLAVFYFITGYAFSVLNLGSATTSLSGAFGMVFTVILILLPLLTMRLMADEKKQKTEQCLLTAPVDLTSIVMGKFFAALSVFIMGMFIYVIYVIVLKSLAGSVAMSEVLGNMLGLLLLGASFISIGIFVSSLTEVQIVAAIVSFVINFVLYMCDIVAGTVTWALLSAMLYAIGFYSRYNEFTQGILNVTSVVYFLSVIFIFNFLTVRTLEKRRWS